MTLLEILLAYSNCPICDDKIKPILRIDAGAIGSGCTSIDYTLTDHRYPLVFRKQLDFDEMPVAFSIYNSAEVGSQLEICDGDILHNDAGIFIRGATLRIYCPRGNHYSCILWKVAPSLSVKVMAVYPRITESIIVGKYQIVNNVNGSRGATIVNIHSNRHNPEGRILSFQHTVSKSHWPLKDLAAFEEKINKLLLLK